MTAKSMERLCVLALAAAAMGFTGGCSASLPTAAQQQKILVDARAVLRQSAEDHDAATRANAMEAIAQVMGAGGGPILKSGLDDPEPMVRFAAAMALGDVAFKPALPNLQEKAKMQVGERDRRTYCAIIYAMYRLGDLSRVGDLADLLTDREAAVRANAAMVMGKIGDASGIGPIKTVMVDERDEGAKYAMYEALATLGDASSQALLEAYARGPYLDLRMASIPALTHEKSVKNMQILHELQSSTQPPRVRVMAAMELARLGEVNSEGYNLCSRCVRNPRQETDRGSGGDQSTPVEVSSLQRLAAMALGLMGNPAAITSLEPLLGAPEGPVRVAAAMSIIRLCGPEAAEPAPRTPAPVAAPATEEAPEEPARGSRLQSAGPKD